MTHFYSFFASKNTPGGGGAETIQVTLDFKFRTLVSIVSYKSLKFKAVLLLHGRPKLKQYMYDKYCITK